MSAVPPLGVCDRIKSASRAPHRRGGRAVDCTGLENRPRRNPSKGSNPFPSAQIHSEKPAFSPVFQTLSGYQAQPAARPHFVSASPSAPLSVAQKAPSRTPRQNRPRQRFHWCDQSQRRRPRRFPLHGRRRPAGRGPEGNAARPPVPRGPCENSDPWST